MLTVFRMGAKLGGGGGEGLVGVATPPDFEKNIYI